MNFFLNKFKDMASGITHDELKLTQNRQKGRKTSEELTLPSANILLQRKSKF